MKVKELDRIWYTSYCNESMVVIGLTFDEVVWERIFTQLKCLYDKDKIEMPKRKVTYRDELRGTLKKYLDENSQLMAEVPSVLSDDEDVELS